MCLMSLLWDSGYFLKRYEDLDGNNLVELVNHMNGKRLCNLTNYTDETTKFKDINMAFLHAFFDDIINFHTVKKAPLKIYSWWCFMKRSAV